MRIENDKFPITNICKSLDMNFISIKKHEMAMFVILVFQWDVGFHGQRREWCRCLAFGDWSIRGEGGLRAVGFTRVVSFVVSTVPPAVVTDLFMKMASRLILRLVFSFHPVEIFLFEVSSTF